MECSGTAMISWGGNGEICPGKTPLLTVMASIEKYLHRQIGGISQFANLMEFVCYAADIGKCDQDFYKEEIFCVNRVLVCCKTLLFLPKFPRGTILFRKSKMHALRFRGDFQRKHFMLVAESFQWGGIWQIQRKGNTGQAHRSDSMYSCLRSVSKFRMTPEMEIYTHNAESGISPYWQTQPHTYSWFLCSVWSATGWIICVTGTCTFNRGAGLILKRQVFTSVFHKN